MAKLFFCLFVVLQMSCMHNSVVQEPPLNQVNIGPESVLTLPEARNILPDVQLVQLLTVEHKESKRTTQVVLTSKDNKLSVVGLFPLGGEAFRVDYVNGRIMTKSMPMPARAFDLRFALADIILVYAETEKLSRWLSPGVTVVDDGLGRTILQSGEPLIKIRYQKDDRFASNVDYEHMLRGYRIHIEPVSQGTP